MTCDNIVDSCLAFVKDRIQCRHADGRLAVVFPFLYPDNDNIELFIQESHDHLTVSDLGHTLRRLDTVGLDLYAGWKFAFHAERIETSYEVSIRNSEFFKRCTAGTVGGAMSDVVSVCLAVAGLANFDDQDVLLRKVEKTLHDDLCATGPEKQR